MNRLIIIGNGFDLAHGLKTKFSDFLAYYWSTLKGGNEKDNFISFRCSHRDLTFENCKTFEDIKRVLNIYSSAPWRFNNGIHLWGDQFSITYKSKFFESLNTENTDPLWVDVEMAYYKELKRIIKLTNNLQSEEQLELIKNQLVKRLNSEIFQFTAAFKTYLKDVAYKKLTNQSGFYPMKRLFENDFLSSNEDRGNFLKEFSHEYITSVKKDPERMNTDHSLLKPKFEETLILNFNFTKTSNLYDNASKHIQIHGSILPKNEDILLGFGDEKDKFYIEIEDLNQNEYLQFMKSSHYTKNDRYKLLFDLIESGPFQIQIMGHSCGLSDRTLLNSIFQHHYCKSIKMFYWEYEKRNEFGEVDNYSEIFRNLSRHFTDKKKMRDIVVNRGYCSPLPQFDD